MRGSQITYFVLTYRFSFWGGGLAKMRVREKVKT